jgi:hypothetical protein
MSDDLYYVFWLTPNFPGVDGGRARRIDRDGKTVWICQRDGQEVKPCLIIGQEHGTVLHNTISLMVQQHYMLIASEATRVTGDVRRLLNEYIESNYVKNPDKPD